MACLIKVPDGTGKGCLSFTTQERDQLISRDSGLRAAVEAVKARFVVGLHHNWHDHSFSYDPLFDFSMAGDGDLIERDGVPFARAPIDACNFTPDCFGASRTEPFWDVLKVARAVAFKGIPEFLQALRQIYDRGRPIRVLYLCPVPPPDRGGTTLHDIRQRYEALFTPDERRLFTLLTMEWDYPFPLDMEALAFFYRASRIFVHSAPEERRCRTAAYAWTSKMPVVGGANVASILPSSCRGEPFWFRCDGDPKGLADAILRALACRSDNISWDGVQSEFRGPESARRLSEFLDRLAAAAGTRMSCQPVNVSRLDIRLGRHHFGRSAPNDVPQDLRTFVDYLLTAPFEELGTMMERSDPELAIAARGQGREMLDRPSDKGAMARLGRGLFGSLRSVVSSRIGSP